MPAKTSETPKVSREAMIAELTNKTAAAYGMEMGEPDEGCGENSLQWAVEQAYDAGYRAAKEDAARLADEMANGCPDFLSDPHHFCEQFGCSSFEELAAEIRKLAGEAPRGD